jgi:hypothetical protein
MTIDGDTRGSCSIGICGASPNGILHFYKLQVPHLIRTQVNVIDGPELPEKFKGNDFIEIQILPFIR